ncbi:MAG TPA: hypothetical protein VEZ40_07645 [Pyrinomonadaceae bacterium]|nr:hypothetical protein [Pyrinomonadaceae bacterium]
MIALFIIAFALLAATAYTLYRRQHASSDYPAQLETRPPAPRSLFDDQETEPERRRLLAAEAGREAAARTASLLKRAAEGDLTALAEAHRAQDPALYASVLDALLDRAADSETHLRSLASFITNDTDLRGSPRLAAAYAKLWREHPDRRRTAQTLHLAALSDDASAFERAVVEATEAARGGRLTEIGREELSALIESEYWILSSAARRTGEGFALKQRLASLRDEASASKAAESPQAES